MNEINEQYASDPHVAAYDDWHQIAELKDETQSPLDLPWYESVWRNIKNHPGGAVLEIGCGRGRFAIWLAKEMPQFRVTGLDFSQAAIELAKQSAASQQAGVRFIQGDAEALPFENNSFDLVISCECMEHVANPRMMAKEMARVLKPGGRFCLTTPSQLNGMMIARLHSLITRRPYDSGAGVQPRENFYFYWTVRRYLQEAGLVVEQMESSHYQWLLLPGVDPARLRTTQFSTPWARRLAFPFGLHFSFFGRKQQQI
ncbi:MAG: class I SAM-dependent methyltransferase [Verrucomicrobiaceae bacterium]